MAIAGGVNLFLHPAVYTALCAQHMLSSDGQCKSFGLGGNGYVPGEGVGTVLLKRLSQAIADEDHIYAVIRGTNINHGGKTNGYTVPNPTAQGQMIRAALDKAGVNARTVSYIEAHGTGTELGDPIEITGLNQAFRKDTQDTQFCAIGSAKSNMGHLEAAAGIAGITKIILQMQHKKIVPSLHSKELNPNINFTKTPFIVQQKLEEWKRPVVEINGVSKEYPRIAGISAFGAGGANAHVIIEEYIPQDAQRPNFQVNAQNPAIIMLSAKDEDRLRAKVQQLLSIMKEQQLNDSDLANIAYTLQVGREAMEERLALLVGSMKELEEKLQGFIIGKNGIEGMYQGQVKRNKETLHLFTADEDLQQVVNIWANKGKYAKILELWVKGLAFDWNKIYGDVKPQRISLPGYPFAKEKLWIPKITKEKRGGLMYQGDYAQISEPLIGRRIVSPLKEMQFEHIISTENLTELKDSHNIMHVGHYQEMLCNAVKSGFNTSSYLIENMEFLAALRLVEGSARVVNLTFSPENERGFMEFQINSRDIKKDQWTLHAKGSCKVNKDIQVDKLSVEQYRDITECGEQYTAAEFYQKMSEQGFHLGNSVKRVDHVWHRKGEIIARFRPFSDEEKKYNYSMGIHPGVWDTCAQFFVFVGQEYLPLGTIFMVVEMQEFNFKYADNRDKTVWCRFILDKDNLDGAYIQGEYTLYNEDGTILAQSKGNKVKKLNLKGMETVDLNRSQAEKIKRSRLCNANGEKSGMKVEVLEDSLRQMMAEQLGMQTEQLDTEEPLRDVGMDSIIAMNFRGMVEKSLGIKISAEDLLEGPSIKDLATTLSLQCGELTIESEDQNKGAIKSEELEESLRQMMAGQLGMQTEQLDTDEPLRDVGMDSIIAMNFRGMVEMSLGIKISAEDLLEGPSIKELAATLSSECGELAVESEDQNKGAIKSEELEELKLEPEKVEPVKEKSNESNIWYAHRRINKNAKFRLFCVPYGGAGASLYRTWQEKLPDYIEVCPIQMPGKESRIKEVPIDNIDDAVDALEKAIKGQLDIPYAFYGHSMGGLIAYRTVYRLWQTAKNKPSHFFVGAYGRADPNSVIPNYNYKRRMDMLNSRGFDIIPTAREVEALPSEQLDYLVHQIGRIGQDVVVEEDIAKKLVAAALSDFRIVDSFKVKEEPIFDIPITAFHGMMDERVPEEEMRAWKSSTTSAFKIHLLSGNHFFLDEDQNQDELLAFIKEHIDLHMS
jgi:acyl transferase domain-containing protein/surfactin synthase thioesterase subunit